MPNTTELCTEDVPDVVVTMQDKRPFTSKACVTYDAAVAPLSATPSKYH